jgi:IPT/TIG domain
MKRTLGLAALTLLASLAWSLPQPPRIFYSDLESGPNTGGQQDQGAFVTIHGKGFGAARGSASVTVGGKPVAGYPVWSDSKITFQLGAAAETGKIVVTVGGQASNGIPFVVRSGKIHFVAKSGSDHNSGTYDLPWRSIVKAVKSMGSGDIAYIMDGVEQTAVDDFDASLSISSSGSAGRPKALVAYPGAQATIGLENGTSYGLRTPDIEGGPFSNWTIAGLTLRGRNESVSLVRVSNWRLVANDISCPNGNGVAACVEVERSMNIKVLGNTIHNAGKPGASKHYHSLYFTTDSNHIEAGWNTISDNHSCRGIQFHSSPNGSNTGLNQYDLIVHDNVIHGQVCDGINFATIDPSKGPVQAYNNVIYHVGTGPDPQGDEANYACISSPGITNRGPRGSGTAEWFNNTLYDCGSRGGQSAGAFNVESGSPSVKLQNNIVYVTRSENYFEPGTEFSRVTASNNLWFGNGNMPARSAASLNVDPKFVDLAKFDFHLQPASPAIRAGSCGGTLFDLDGLPRPEGGRCDLGAFQSRGATSVP